MDNLKRSMKRFFTRLSILAIVVVCGAIAIAQAQRDKTTAETGTGTAETNMAETTGGPDTLLNVSDPSLATIRDVDRQWSRAPSPSINEVPRGDDSDLIAEVPSHTGAEDRLDLRVAPMVVDDQVQQVDYESNSRFGEPENVPSEQPPAANPVRDRFAGPPMTDGFDAPELDGFDPPAADGLAAPALIGDGGMVPSGDRSNPMESEQPYEPENSFDGATQQDFPGPGPDRFGAAGQTPAAVPPAQARFANNAPASAPPVQDRFANNVPQRSLPDQDFRSDETFRNPIRGDSSPAEVDASVEAPPASYNPIDTGSYADEIASDPVADESAFPNDPYTQEELPPAVGQPTVSGAGRPGPHELEGVQAPSLALQKIAPVDVRVGQPATFQIKVRNTGPVPAERVVIRDEVPLGTELLGTTPEATADASGAVLWSLGTLRPGQESTVSMQVNPLEEGEIGSVATVAMHAQVSARAEATRPRLEIVHEGPQQVLVGQPVRFAIELSNPGTGPAAEVVLEEDVPEGLAHSQGPQLEYEVGTIDAGRNRRLELSLTAEKPGLVENVIRARAAGGLVAEHRIQLEVVAPQLQIKVKGPTRRYLDRKATFSVSIENPGTAAARNVELKARLPRGLKFVSTNNSGRFDRASNTIRWSLDKLPARQFGEVQFTAVPVQMGEFDIAAEAVADKGLNDAQSHRMVVEGIAALLFTVIDQDPIEVGAVTTYEIKVKNQGTGEAKNVELVAVIPPGMRPVGAEGDTNYQVDGDRVRFEKILSLPPKGESTFKVQVEGLQPGDHRFRAIMTSDETTTPVVNEESTRVYAD